MKPRIVAWGVVLSLCTAELPWSVVEAQDAKSTITPEEAAARDSFQRGRIHYDNGDFNRAAIAFEEAYQLSGRHALLYNLYLAYRDSNQQEKAAEALRAYLQKVEVIDNRAQLEARLKALDAGIAARKAEEQRKLQEAQQAQAAQPANNTAPQTTTDAAPSNERWWLVPAVVTGAGGALMLGSLATGLMARSKQSELEDKCKDNVCDSSLKSTADSGKTLALVTDVLLFGGIATAATGAVLFFLKKPSSSDEAAGETPSASFVCTPRACGGAMSMRF